VCRVKSAQLCLLNPLRSHFQLLCAVVLSAQTTDKKVNEVTPALFAVAPTPAEMSALPVEAIEAHIRQVGLAPSKAKYLRTLSAQLLERHGGEVPATLTELEALAGVGHKTASVVRCVGALLLPTPAWWSWSVR
jgi:endonuclease III